MATYPEQPGWRHQAKGETAREAALAVTASAKPMMQMIEDMLGDGPASPEMLAERLSDMMGRRILLTSVRARCTQLNKLGRIVDSGLRSLGESGRSKVIVWALATAEQRAAFEAAKAAASAAANDGEARAA